MSRLHSTNFANYVGMNILNYLPFLGPTFATYEELAVMASSGMAPDSIPRGSLHEPRTNGHLGGVVTRRSFSAH